MINHLGLALARENGCASRCLQATTKVQHFVSVLRSVLWGKLLLECPCEKLCV